MIFAVATGVLMSGSTLEREKRHMCREKIDGWHEEFCLEGWERDMWVEKN